MQPRLASRIFCIAAPVLLCGCSMGGPAFSESRASQVPVSGAKLLKLDVGAGYLRVQGKAGSGTITVSGISHAQSTRALAAVKFVTRRSGDTIFITCVIPPPDRAADAGASLDIEVKIPSALPLEVTDSTGESVFRNTGPLRIVHGDGGLNVDSVAGRLDITDGAGDMAISHVAGNVRIVDGRGAIYVTHIAGSVVIPQAGSGEIQAVDISGDVAVGSKRSGEVAAREIGGKLSVSASGNGSIEYRDVAGGVAAPAGEYH
jgi:hypothetical protein